MRPETATTGVIDRGITNCTTKMSHFRHLGGIVCSTSAYNTSGHWFESHSCLKSLHIIYI